MCCFPLDVLFPTRHGKASSSLTFGRYERNKRSNSIRYRACCRYYSVVVIARYGLGSVNFRMANDRFDTGFIYLLSPIPEDADRLNNTTWRWMGERTSSIVCYA